MDGSLLSVGMSGKLLTSEDFVHPWDMPNLTNKALRAIFPEIPEDAVRHRHMAIIGMMESGKSSLYNYLAMEAKRRYGDELNLIPVYSIRKGMDLMNRKKVQFILVDDAVSQANSRQAMKQAQDVADFFQIRHRLEALSNERSGVVITAWATQRFKSLDPVFRQGHILIFKTSSTDPDDAKLIRDYVGITAYEELQNITEAIYIDADDAAKGTSICTIPVAAGVTAGHFRSPYVRPFLKFLDSDEIYEPGEEFLFNVGAELEKYRKRPEWRRAANIYYRSVVEQLTYEQIAEKEKLHPSTVGEHVLRMRGEMSRVAGASYELYKAKQLQQRGYDVQHFGGNGEPDLVARQGQSGGVWVYSCKCLDFDRKVRMPMEELAPEIRKAREINAGLILSVFNLHDRIEQELPIEKERPPQVIDILPFQ